MIRADDVRKMFKDMENVVYLFKTFPPLILGQTITQEHIDRIKPIMEELERWTSNQT